MKSFFAGWFKLGGGRRRRAAKGTTVNVNVRAPTSTRTPNKSESTPPADDDESRTSTTGPDPVHSPPSYLSKRSLEPLPPQKTALPLFSPVDDKLLDEHTRSTLEPVRDETCELAWRDRTNGVSAAARNDWADHMMAENVLLHRQLFGPTRSQEVTAVSVANRTRAVRPTKLFPPTDISSPSSPLESPITSSRASSPNAEDDDEDDSSSSRPQGSSPATRSSTSTDTPEGAEPEDGNEGVHRRGSTRSAMRLINRSTTTKSSSSLSSSTSTRYRSRRLSLSLAMSTWISSRPASPTISLSQLGNKISTCLDSEGRRVLARGGRPSSQDSSVEGAVMAVQKTKKQKKVFGIGDEQDSSRGSDHDGDESSESEILLPCTSPALTKVRYSMPARTSPSIVESGRDAPPGTTSDESLETRDHFDERSSFGHYHHHHRHRSLTSIQSGPSRRPSDGYFQYQVAPPPRPFPPISTEFEPLPPSPTNSLPSPTFSFSSPFGSSVLSRRSSSESSHHRTSSGESSHRRSGISFVEPPSWPTSSPPSPTASPSRRRSVLIAYRQECNSTPSNSITSAPSISGYKINRTRSPPRSRRTSLTSLSGGNASHGPPSAGHPQLPLLVSTTSRRSTRGRASEKETTGEPTSSSHKSLYVNKASSPDSTLQDPLRVKRSEESDPRISSRGRLQIVNPDAPTATPLLASTTPATTPVGCYPLPHHHRPSSSPSHSIGTPIGITV